LGSDGESVWQSLLAGCRTSGQAGSDRMAVWTALVSMFPRDPSGLSQGLSVEPIEASVRRVRIFRKSGFRSNESRAGLLIREGIDAWQGFGEFA